MKNKLGPAGATMATARKIAVIFYTMVKGQIEYDEGLWAQQDEQRQKRFEAKLKRQAQNSAISWCPLPPKPQHHVPWEGIAEVLRTPDFAP